ncbi:hypothetical protein TNCV_2777981 [Trichonephila clavipes]|nr:hypothetical protein TNCV_2777981 [Trichonephila clavipes]
MKVRAVIRCEWTYESSVSVPHGHLLTVYPEEVMFHQLVVSAVACSKKECRLLRMKVDVGIPTLSQMKQHCWSTGQELLDRHITMSEGCSP